MATTTYDIKFGIQGTLEVQETNIENALFSGVRAFYAQTKPLLVVTARDPKSPAKQGKLVVEMSSDLTLPDPFADEKAAHVRRMKRIADAKIQERRAQLTKTLEEFTEHQRKELLAFRAKVAAELDDINRHDSFYINGKEQEEPVVEVASIPPPPLTEPSPPVELSPTHSESNDNKRSSRQAGLVDNAAKRLDVDQDRHITSTLRAPFVAYVTNTDFSEGIIARITKTENLSDFMYKLEVMLRDTWVTPNRFRPADFYRIFSLSWNVDSAARDPRLGTLIRIAQSSIDKNNCGVCHRTRQLTHQFDVAAVRTCRMDAKCARKFRALLKFNNLLVDAIRGYGVDKNSLDTHWCRIKAVIPEMLAATD